MTSHFFVDIHCHPSIKAYARSFENIPGNQSASSKNNTSIWYQDPPSLFDKLKNYIAGLTNFIQSDASSLIKGRVSVVCLSFYPQEKAFFNNKAGEGIVSDALTLLATEFGEARINYLQGLQSYWEDLLREMKFLQQRQDSPVTIDGKRVMYKIAGSFAEIELAEKENALGETLVIFVPTIEGAHVFDQMINSYQDYKTFPGGIAEGALETTLARVRTLRLGKEGYLRPAFITFAHHFWNGLCGHARSLGGLVKCIVDQENGLGSGFTAAGYAVAKAMLEPLTSGAGSPVLPIIIDIKHMSRASREDYFKFLDTTFPQNNIPVLASHGGVTGLSAPGGQRNTAAAIEGLYMEEDINIYDDEIIMIERTRGIVGIQLDERRIGSKQALRGARGHIARRDILYAWSRLVWNQVRHMAEVLDMQGKFAWGIQALGTDFDGIIDPINGYWTAKEMDDLDDYLLKHAFDYMKGIHQPCPLLQAMNKNTSAEEIVDRVMTSNAIDFLSRIY